MIINDNSKMSIYYSCCFFNAIKNGNIRMAKLSIKLGNIDITDDHMHICVKNGYVKFLEHFAELGYDIFNDKLMGMAIEYEQIEIIKYLTINGVSVNVLFPDTKNIYVTKIVEKGNLEILRFLIENGANFREYSNQLFEICIEYRHPEIIRYLNSQNAEYDEDDLIGPIVDNCDFEIIRIFVEECKISIDAIKCIFFSTVDFGFLDIVEYLINKCGNEYLYGIWEALENDHIHIVEYIISNYSDKMKNNPDEDEVYSICCILAKKDLSKYQSLVLFLREIGVDIYDLIENEL